MTNKDDSARFLDNVDKVVHKHLPEEGGWVLWRGRYPHTVGSQAIEYDTIIADRSDQPDGTEATAVPTLMIWVERNEHGSLGVKFKKNNILVSICPFLDSETLSEIEEMVARFLTTP